MDGKKKGENKSKFGSNKRGSSSLNPDDWREHTTNLRIPQMKEHRNDDQMKTDMRDNDLPGSRDTSFMDTDGDEGALACSASADSNDQNDQTSNTVQDTTDSPEKAKSLRQATLGTLQLKIKAAKNAFVETNIFKQAKQSLQEYGHLTLSGMSGEGKTTTALMLADHYEQRGYSLLFVDSLDNFDIDNFVNTSTRTFIIFDDIFGTVGTSVNIGQVRIVLNHLVLHMEHKNKSNDLMDSSDELLEESIEDRTSKQKKKKRRKKDIMVVFTSRSYLMEEALRQLREYSRDLFRRESRMDLSKKGEFSYSEFERKKILMTLKEIHEHEFDDDFDIETICKVTHLIFGFPLICKLYFENARFQKDATKFFADPLSYLRRELEEIIESRHTKPGMAAALILPLLCDGKVNLAKLESRKKDTEDILKAIKDIVPNVTVSNIRQAAATFSGTFLQSKNDIVTFTHSSIYDACACALYEVCPAFVLKYCSLKFLLERVQPRIVDNTSINDQLHLIYLSENYQKQLVYRLSDEIQNGETELTFSHSVLKSPENVDLLLDEMTLDLSESGSHKNKHILGWAVHSGSMYLVEKLLQEYEVLSSEEDVGEAIVAAALTGAADILRFLKGKYSRCFTPRVVNHCLLLAASNNKHKVVNYLVEIGAVGDARDNKGQNILHIACRNDSEDIVTTLLPVFEKNISILNDVDKQGYSPVMIAALNGNKHIFEKLFKAKNIDIQQEDGYGDSLIHHACKGGNISIVKMCLPKFDINSRGNGGWTPIMIAASSGNKGLFDLLLENKANVTLLDDDDNCLLHHASVGDNKFIIQWLLPQFDINIKGADGATPITYAVGLRNLEAFEFLLSKKPDLQMKMKGGNSLLHLACQCGSTAMVRKLMPLFDINIRGEHGWTPLMKAAVKGNEHVFQCLVKGKAYDNLTDNYNDNLLHLACQGGNTSIVKFLLPKFDKHCIGNHRWTPIMKAIVCDHTNIFNLLFDESDLQRVDAFGDSLLHFACETGNIEVVKRLVCTRVIDVNKKGKQGWTPIMEAAVNGHSEVFHLLLDRNADTSQVTFEGDSLLHLACHGGKKDIVECLLSAHNRDKLGNDGSTPIMIAAMNGHEELFSFLMKGSPDTTVRDQFGDHLLNLACRGGSDIIVNELLSVDGIDIDKKGKEDLSPIMVSALYGHKDVFVLLQGKKAKTTLADISGRYLIHIACTGGNAAIVRKILTPKNTNQKDGKRGWTPVMTAAACGHKQVFDMLMRLKADLRTVSSDGENILDLAKKGGNAKIVKKLS